MSAQTLNKPNKKVDIKTRCRAKGEEYRQFVASSVIVYMCY